MLVLMFGWVNGHAGERGLEGQEMCAFWLPRAGIHEEWYVHAVRLNLIGHDLSQQRWGDSEAAFQSMGSVNTTALIFPVAQRPCLEDIDPWALLPLLPSGLR